MSPEAETLSVLVVDDDIVFARSLMRQLRLSGWDVEHAADGADALRLIQERPFHAMVLDLQMQNVSGLGVLEGLPGVAQAPATILLSGHLDIPTTVQAMRAGVVDVLEKPTAAADLDRLLRKAVGARQRGAGATDSAGSEPPHAAAPATKVREVERAMILETFQACGGNLSRAARELGLPRTTLRDKLRRYGNR
ncbi:MAG: response regulator [Polyangiaceae bacterium]|nr:response regulator [Polyangiaceae bacterium]